MSLNYLYANIADSAWTSTVQSPGNQSTGMRFTPIVDSTLKRLGWRRPTTNSGVEPSALAVWDASGPTKIAEVTSVGATTGVGWKWFTPPQQPLCLRGREYRISVWTENNHEWSRGSYASLPLPSANLSFVLPARCAVSGSAGAVWPANTDTAYIEGFDVELDDANAGQPGTITPTYLTGTLEQYLDSASSDPISTSIPREMKTEQTAQGLQIDAVETSVGTDLVGDVAAVAGDVASILTSVGSGIGAAVTNIWNTVNDATTGMAATNADVNAIGTSILTGDPNSLQAIANSVGTALERLGVLPSGTTATFLTAIRALVAPAANQVPLAGTGWAMTDQTDFTTELAWAEPADVYVLSFTSPPTSLATVSVAGVEWMPRLLWWAELNQTQAGERHYLDFPGGQIFLPGRRMAGLLLRCYGPADGHVQAWTYTAP